MLRPRKYKDLERRLGHKFRNQELIERALTHASMRGGRVAKRDNERLEFIGDRVLGLAIVEAVSQAFPEAREGELARRYNGLVKGDTCAIVGRELGLGEFMILSESEDSSGGRQKDTILADAIEAVLGAVFLDGGFDAARDVVLKLWDPMLSAGGGEQIDAKSVLQEWAQGKGLSLPHYVEVTRDGPDHAPHFTTEVRIAGCDPARGKGRSKRQSEQAAARELLKREGVLGQLKYD
ncbi:MAG: ribonuclease III [Alphaproteobacteria bacterium]|nr:ribonuclease III [Alphaproteobacteria bacterium]